MHNVGVLTASRFMAPSSQSRARLEHFQRAFGLALRHDHSMSRTLCLLGWLMVLGVGCAAPQRAGGERTAFLAMATTSGSLAGGLGVGLSCSLLRYGLKHKPPKGIDATDAACILAGAVAGAGASYYASSESEESPGFEHWATVSIGSAAAVAIITAFVIEAFD